MHMANLPTKFSGRAGRELLRCYYFTVTQQLGACGYVAKKNNEIIGFVCGVWQPVVVLRKLIQSKWFELIFWGVIQSLVKPSFIINFLARFISSSNRMDIAKAGYELRPLVVSPAARGDGVAGMLLDSIVEDAAKRGFRRIFLFAKYDNVAANKFYQKSGFRSVGKTTRYGIPHLIYEKEVKINGIQ